MLHFAIYPIVAYHWEYYTNFQDENEPIIYHGKYYLPYLRAEELSSIEQSVTDYYAGGMQLGFGDVSIINADGYWDARLSNYVYEWKKIEIKVVNLGDAVGDITTLWLGIIGDVEWRDDVVQFEVLDPREI
jgi:hypothetical protein